MNRRWIHSGPPSFGFTLNRESLQARGLVAWWPMGANKGVNTLRDLVNGKEGQITGATWEASSLGGTLQFVAASSALVDVDGVAPLLNPEAGTIHMVVRTDVVDATSDEYCYFSSSNNLHSVFMVNDASQNMGITYRVISSFFNAKVSTPAGLTTSGFRWLTGTWGTDVNFYLDGALVAGPTSRTSTWGDAITQGAIGATASATNYLNGAVADARIYDRTLSASEVRHLFAPQTRWDLYLPVDRRSMAFVAAVGGLSIPVAMRSYRNRRLTNVS